MEAKTKEEILRQQEVHQVNIGGIVYEMVKFRQAEKAMQAYHDQFKPDWEEIEEQFRATLTLSSNLTERETKDMISFFKQRIK